MSSNRNKVVTSAYSLAEISDLLAKFDKFGAAVVNGRHGGKLAVFPTGLCFLPLINAAGTGHERLVSDLLRSPEAGWNGTVVPAGSSRCNRRSAARNTSDALRYRPDATNAAT